METRNCATTLENGFAVCSSEFFNYRQNADHARTPPVDTGATVWRLMEEVRAASVDASSQVRQPEGRTVEATEWLVWCKILRSFRPFGSVVQPLETPILAANSMMFSCTACTQLGFDSMSVQNRKIPLRCYIARYYNTIYYNTSEC